MFRARVWVRVGRVVFGRVLILLLACGFALSAMAAKGSPTRAPSAEIQAFVDEMVAKHAFDRDALEALLAKARISNPILASANKPFEARPWHHYRAVFLTPERIEAGRAFIRANEPLLAHAQQVFGVSARIIAAIIGVETYYGQRMGRHRVLDALATLAFRHPKRGGFFRRELAQFLLMIREEARLDPLAVKGSYAGAMGIPQFIPSSYRHYGVDFDEDGVKDLFGSVDDAVGSVGNYLKRHGWRANEGIAHRAILVEEEGLWGAFLRFMGIRERGNQDAGLSEQEKLSARCATLAAKGAKPHIPYGKLEAQGIRARSPLPDDEQVALIELRADGGRECWIVRKNFYVITRYNHSNLYAMAVNQLADALAREAGGDVE